MTFHSCCSTREILPKLTFRKAASGLRAQGKEQVSNTFRCNYSSFASVSFASCAISVIAFNVSIRLSTSPLSGSGVPSVMGHHSRIVGASNRADTPRCNAVSAPMLCGFA